MQTNDFMFGAVMILGEWIHLYVYLPFLQRETTFVTSFLFHSNETLPKIGILSKGKNLLQEEQIHVCNSYPLR